MFERSGVLYHYAPRTVVWLWDVVPAYSGHFWRPLLTWHYSCLVEAELKHAAECLARSTSHSEDHIPTGYPMAWLFALPGPGWRKERENQTIIWERKMKKLTECPSRLPGWGSEDQKDRSLVSLMNMAQNRNQWREHIRFCCNQKWQFAHKKDNKADVCLSILLFSSFFHPDSI